MDSERTPSQIFQSGTEWYKLVYDFYKHFMTIALASIAAVGTLLGGVFRDAIGPKAGSMTQVLITIVFAAFIITLMSAVEGMHLARSKVLAMHKVANFCEFKTVRAERGDKFPRFPPSVIWSTVWSSYVVGIVAFVLLLVTSVFGYGVRGSFYVIVTLAVALFLYLRFFGYGRQEDDQG